MKISELITKTIAEDWGSSDWYPVMQEMNRLLDSHFGGKRDDDSLEKAAQDVAITYYEDMGWESAEEAAPSIVRMYKVRNKDKLTEATGKTKGAWKIQNLSGVMKTFKDDETADARAWMRNRGDAKQVWLNGRWQQDPKAADREFKKSERERLKWEREDRKAEQGPKVDLKAVYDKAIAAIGNTFPDGDPIDHLIGPLKRMGVPEYSIGEYIDKAMKKHGHGVEKKGMYEYMAVMWDEMAKDAMFDAKNGHEAREPFVRMVKGEPQMQDNPWKSS